jgi:hypothetical protein
MAKVSPNRNNLLAVRLLQLRRHLVTCRQCKAAMKASDFGGLCKATVEDVLFIASKWDSNIPDRLAASRSGTGLTFICPDPNAHGAAYAATAEPVTIAAVQPGLF